MRSVIARASCMVALAAILVLPGGESAAGTCSVPVSAYFFHGAPLAQGPGGRVLVPTRVDIGREACLVGSGVDAFVVPPGVHFVRAELQTPIGTPPGYCAHGLGLAVCATSEAFTSSTTGQRYAKTDTHVLDPTVVSGGFTVTFQGFGPQSYRTLAP